MLEDNESVDVVMIQKCDFCKKKIKFMPVHTIDRTLKFCDLICAKLYYDNVKKITINRLEYNNYFINDQLSKSAKEIYNRVGKVLFKQLPIYVQLQTDEAYGSPELMKKKYNKIISPTLFK